MSGFLNVDPEDMIGWIRGHVQTIFGKISVNMTWGVACDANFFVCVLLSFC